jgi:hypothetical protein
MKFCYVGSEVTKSKFFTSEVAEARTIPVGIDRFLKSQKIMFSHFLVVFSKFGCKSIKI